MLVPNRNYCVFEDWVMPIFNQMHKEQKEDGVNWTPSKVGEEEAGVRGYRGVLVL